MADWWAYNFECADVPSRERLVAWFEREHPVTVPDDRYSVVAALDVGDGTAWADFAWVGRSLYVTTRRETDLLRETMDRWERAAVAEFDAGSGTAREVTLVLDSEAGDDDEVAGGRFGGVEGLGGMDVMYSLAMRHQFRFRSYAGVPPAGHRGPHPDAFTAVDVRESGNDSRAGQKPTASGDAADAFVADMADATGVEPTDEGLAFLRDDPADDDRYVFGETYGPVDHDFDLEATGPLDGGGAERTTLGDLSAPGDVPASGDRPGTDEDADSVGRGLLGRLRGLFGR